MKIKKFFNLRKGDFLTASNLEDRLFITKTPRGKLNVYENSDNISSLNYPSLKDNGYITASINDYRFLICNPNNGFAKIIKNGLFFDKNVVFYKEENSIYEINVKEKTIIKRFQLINSFSIISFYAHNFYILGYDETFLILKREYLQDCKKYEFYLFNQKECIYRYMMPRHDSGFLYPVVEKIDNIVYINIMKSDYTNFKLKTFRLDEIYNPSSFKGEYE